MLPAAQCSHYLCSPRFGQEEEIYVVVTDQLPAPDELSWFVTASLFGTTSISGGDFLTASSLILPAGATISLTVSAFIPLDIFTHGGVNAPLVLHNIATLAATGIGPITSDDVLITVLDQDAREELI